MEGLILRDARRRRPADLNETAAPRSGSRHALVVGIDAYDERFFRRLRYATEDARAIADRLEQDFGFRATRLLDDQATAQAIRGALVGWQTEARPEDDVLVFFSGHGANHSDPARQHEGYLLPVEASEDPVTWLAEADLIQWARALPAQRVFVVLDACYAGTALRLSTAIEPGEPVDQVLDILVAGTEDQPVLDGGAGVHSIFTKALLDGLDGLADSGQNPDGTLTATELIAFAQSEVPWRSRTRGHEQTPVGGPLHGTRSGSDFQFRPIHPRLSAALLRNLYSHAVGDRTAAVEQLQALRGTDRAELAADELINLVHTPTPAAGQEGWLRQDLMKLRQAAANSLGLLGHPRGFQVLTETLDPQQPPELRAAAASALGVLAENPEQRAGYDLAELRGRAIEALIGSLGASDSQVSEAAKKGLSHLLDASPLLKQELEEEGTRSERGKELLDALAWLGDRYPNDERSWPALPGFGSRFRRRAYLARRRLRPGWPDLVRRAGLVGLFGAIGMGLAFLFVIVAIHWDYRLVYGSAVLSLNALPGLAAGASFVLLPHLARGLARRPDQTAHMLGALAAGLLLGVWMGIPHAFWGVGTGIGGSPPYLTWLCQALPGLVVGPILGLTLARLPWHAPVARAEMGAIPPTASHRGNGLWILLVAAAGGLILAALKIPRPLSFRALDPHWVEVLWWGVGGAFFGAALAIGWSLSLERRGTGLERAEEL